MLFVNKLLDICIGTCEKLLINNVNSSLFGKIKWDFKI